MKLKEIRNFIYEVYTDSIFSMIDVEEFIKREIETKGIIVVDELDKLVKGVMLLNVIILIRLKLLIHLRQVMKEFSTICFPCLMELQFLLVNKVKQERELKLETFSLWGLEHLKR
jgi:hypothetical protein